MKWSLNTAADYFISGKATRDFKVFLWQARRIFTFTAERANRLARFLKIVHAYKAGRPINKIVEEFGCSRGTILRYARMAGLPKRSKSDDPERHAKIIQLSKQGLSQEQIAARCNCSVALVSKVECASGLERYKRIAQRQASTRHQI